MKKRLVTTILAILVLSVLLEVVGVCGLHKSLRTDVCEKETLCVSSDGEYQEFSELSKGYSIRSVAQTGLSDENGSCLLLHTPFRKHKINVTTEIKNLDGSRQEIQFLIRLPKEATIVQNSIKVNGQAMAYNLLPDSDTSESGSYPVVITTSKKGELTTVEYAYIVDSSTLSDEDVLWACNELSVNSEQVFTAIGTHFVKTTDVLCVSIFAIAVGLICDVWLLTWFFKNRKGRG